MSPRSLLASLALTAAVASAAEYEDMGPAAFMWPSDRVWSAAADNNAPCGSIAAPENRTNFPMEKGLIALVAQDDSWEVELSISYLDDPRADSDFTTLIDAEAFRQMDPGHTCVPLTDAPDSVTPGDKATLQVKYIADFDTPQNQTFYACADITFVETATFDIEVPCFNATGPDDGTEAGPGWDYHDDEGDENTSDSNTGDSNTSNSPPVSDPAKSTPKKSSSLGGGAIAGIVIGALAGVGMIAAAALVLYRRKQRRERAFRQAAAARGVKWNERDAAKTSTSTASVRMQNLQA